jgi:hypothetical protein
MITMGCTKSPGTQQEIAISAGAAVKNAPDQALVLTQTSLLPGTTSVEPSAALVIFQSSSIEQRDKIVPLLARNASVLSDEGETIGISAEFASAKMPPDGMQISVTPARILKTDHWYTLNIKEDSDLQLSNGKSQLQLAARLTGM